MSLATTITILLISFVGIALLILFRDVRNRQKTLREERRVLLDVVESNEEEPTVLRRLVEARRHELASKGYKQLNTQARQLFIERTQASAREELSAIASLIELMPQIGLLGTIAGITLNMWLSPEGMFDSLGAALITTLMGLVTAIISKYIYERQAEESCSEILVITQLPYFRSAIKQHLNADKS